MDAWDSLLKQWRLWQRAMNFAPGTIELRVYWLKRLAREFPGGPATVDFDELLVWYSGHDWKPSTRRAARASFRVFWAWLIDAGHATESPAARLPKVKIPRPMPRPAPEGDFRFALSISDRRTRLAIMLAGYCGMRRFEIAKARREDMEPDLAGYSLRVVGKGGHVRLVPLPDEVVVQIKQVSSGPLFPSTRKQDAGRPISPGWLGKLVARNLPGDLTTHTLRHRCATVAYDGTKDLRAVQELLGHSKPEITAMYTKVSDRDVRKAMQAAVA